MDNLILGLAIGLCLPIAAYGILLTAVDALDAYVLGADTTISRGFRDRTLSVVAICANLIPFHHYRRKYCDNTMRGLVFPTVAWVAVWFWMYGMQLVGL